MISFHVSQPRSIAEILRNISVEDRKALIQLLQSLLFEDQFAYNLFGSKPITHKRVFFDTDLSNFIPQWQILKRYLSFMDGSLSNFAFLEKAYPESFEIHFVKALLPKSAFG